MRKRNTISQKELVQIYADKNNVSWNEASGAVGDYDEGEQEYDLIEIEMAIEEEWVTDTMLLLKEIMIENKIKSIYLSRN